jgi:hypothetical protein
VFRRNSKLLQSKYGYGSEGYKFTKDNSALLEVPMDLLADYGGNFSKTELLQIIESKTPADLSNIIEWVYPRTDVDIKCIESKKVKITFKDNINSSEEYVIFKKRNKNDKYEELVFLSSSANEYIDEDLESNEVYYYKVNIRRSEILFPNPQEIEVYVK